MVLTPAMQQYYDIKKNYKDSILFFRMWDFYEMFSDDAIIAHKVLGIAITSRNKNSANPELLAWIPFHAKEKYLSLLVNAWYKVAIAEQVSNPKLKWIVKREVVRVVTPATLSLEWENYWNSIDSNFIVSIVESDNKYWISILDISSNNWRTWEFWNFDLLATEVYKIAPKEVVLQKKLFNNEKIKDILLKKYSLNIYYFEPLIEPRKKLLEHFKTKNLEWFWLENRFLSIKASALLLEYIEANQKQSLEYLDTIKYDSFSWYLDLDESTIRNLDLIYNFNTQSSKVWTLFWILDETKTSAWARLLKSSILNPLLKKEDIEKRINIIEELLKDKIILDKITDKLKWVSDIDIILNRIALWRALPRDLLNLKKSLKSIIEVLKLIWEQGSDKLKQLLNIK